MALNAIGAARRRACLDCERRITRRTGPGEKWGEECCYAGFQPAERLTLSRDFYNRSNEDACPAGKWQGLEPVDLEARREQGRLERAAAQVRTLGPILATALDDLDDIERAERIRAVADGHNLEPEARQALLDGMAAERQV